MRRPSLPAALPRTALTALLAALLANATGASGDDETVSFRRDVAPLLLDNCLACHGPKKAEGGYRIDTFERAAGFGDSEIPGFTAGDLEGSEAYRRMASEDEFERMPLEGEPVPAEQLKRIARWIQQGAKFDGPDPQAPLVSIIPAPKHPDPPETYPHTLPITALQFTADGSRLVASGYHELTVWNLDDGQLAARIPNVGQRTMGLATHPDGQRVAVACGDPGRLGEVRLMNIESGELLRVYGSTADVMLDVAFSPDGKRLAAAAADSVLRVYDTDSGELKLTIGSHSDWVTAVAWSADGKRLASASRDKSAKVFDSESGELLASYTGHGQPVMGVAFHPDGKQVYSAGEDKKIHRWKIDDTKKQGDVGFGGQVYKLPVAGDYLFAASADRTVRQLEAASQKEVRKYSGHDDWALCVAYHGPTQRVAAGSFNGEIRVWNAEDGSELLNFVAAPGRE